ncbi:hypothetical protein C5B90_19255 [Haloferax sp. Atlit-12N]|uniref:hypothetical protein n=1 Tax=Haloferax sp. Atlit-12N TaxID=2077203 RepID=UPI000E22B434|nr:hypothetical protein [Haloferax sp. Atlit-12N]RDZ61410.1 hypothetical protein C5B90_19255 [Haloferax sp. Atlit-12N]
MRKHFYLVVESEKNPDREGGVSIYENQQRPSSKNEQTVHQMRNLETNETWTKTMVSLGYVDFEDEDDYEERAHEKMLEKLAEIDESHLRDAGLDPEEVFD